MSRKLLFAALACACASGSPKTPGGPPPTSDAQARLAAQKPVRLETTDAQKRLDALIDGWFQRAATRRSYIMVDKPLYQPGETIWFRADLRMTATLQPASGYGVNMQLLSPRGAIVAQKRVLVRDGVAANDFVIPDDAQGGEYVLQLTGDDGTVDKRAVILSTYEAPRLKKTLEFLRKAYGPGDKVAAAVEIARGTGEPFAGKGLVAVVVLDDAEMARVPFTTDAQGKAVVKFELPAAIARGDALLTILADDGGVTESIQRRVPILMKTVKMSLYPEGGDLVTGLPGRVYFSAENTLGKPADVEGRVLDDRGHEVAAFRSVHDGLGRFEITPQPDRRYHAEITKPAGITSKVDLPAAKGQGCTMQAIDDFDSKEESLRVAAWCSQPRSLIAEAVLRERRVASGSLDVRPGEPAVIAFPVDRAAQGAVRVTLFSDKHAPLAERLIYRGRGRDLRVSITPDKKKYTPRGEVTLTVKTTDLAGKPVPASLGLSVVDDTVLSFADDKTATMTTHIYLEKELGEITLEEPNFYFSKKPEAAAALDAVMATKGWRRFEWQPVLSPPPPPPAYPMGGAGWDQADVAGMAAPEAMPAPEPAPPPAAAPPMANAKAKPAKPGKAAGRGAIGLAKGMKDAPKQEPVVREQMEAEKPVARRPALDARKKRAMDRDDDGEWAGDEMQQNQWAWAPVRVFPAPSYDPGYEGPRTDFRETIFWAPDVRTSSDGTAKVSFHVSDAVTSFRAVAEGSSAGGLPGRGEAIVQSKMPLSLDARLPLEVSAGDVVEIPVSITNETDRKMEARLSADIGKAFVTSAPGVRTVALEPGKKQTFFYRLDVKGNGKEAPDGKLRFSLAAAGLSDEIAKTVKVSPLGFPFEVSLAGTVKGTERHEVNLGGALPGTITASVQMYPSPLASMTEGTEAILREPGGCFEQTSASNYPNTMVLQYLETSDAADPQLVDKAQSMLGRGYKILAGYETKEKGYEWFGQNPGHEALTAYGIMEFEDMAKVDDAVDRQMIERTAAWLMTRRDGKGGFERNPRALDSFGRASYETTNGYIMWALSEAKRVKGLDKELAVQKKMGLESKDPYLVALAANVFLNVAPNDAETQTIVKRLAAMQGKDGSFAGARESITMSGGESLAVETTALAGLALIRAAGEHEPAIRASVEWLNGKRDGWGSFASTQGTVLTLKTLAAYAEHSRQTQSGGVARVRVNGKQVGEIRFEKGRKAALEFDDVAAALRPGKNTIEVTVDSEAPLPYSVAIGYRAARPQSSRESKVAIATKLAKASVRIGEGVRLTATVENRTQGGVPMTLARVGIPGGLTFQTWQLKELREKGAIDFYETREREVILYWRALAPSAKKEVPIDLVATVPGHFVAPATSGYLYYTDEHKAWVAPVEVSVTK
jgi:alpha-2-macroglobulin-like protein